MILVTKLSSICRILFQTQINMNLNPTIEVKMNPVIKAMFIRSVLTRMQKLTGNGPYQALNKLAPQLKITNEAYCFEWETKAIFINFVLFCNNV